MICKGYSKANNKLINSYSDNGPKECSLEVDLDNPDELYDLNNDYLLSPEKICVKKILSEYQLQIIEKEEFSLGKNEKLIPNLGDKKIQTPL